VSGRVSRWLKGHTVGEIARAEGLNMPGELPQQTSSLQMPAVRVFCGGAAGQQGGERGEGRGRGEREGGEGGGGREGGECVRRV
jgi:hypothetical protein